MRRYGPWVAYVAVLVITLPVVLFPMFPNWWLLVWCAALLAGSLWGGPSSIEPGDRPEVWNGRKRGRLRAHQALGSCREGSG